MKATFRNAAMCAAACACLGHSPTLIAQDNGWIGGVGGNWTDSESWQWETPPETQFDARGIIGSNADSNSPIGEVDLTTAATSPTLVLGDGANTRGTLNIASSGDLSVVASELSAGFLTVGTNGGVGALHVEGSLSVEVALESRTTSGGDSTITLQGAAHVTAGGGFLDRRLVVDGPSVNASFSDYLVLGSAGTHIWRIPASGASTLRVGGDVDLGGTLRVEFPDGVPSLGTTWNLIDSASVDGGETPGSGFNNIDQSAVDGLGPGTTFAVRSVADAGSVHGIYTQLTLEQHPVLVVDRQTGSVSLQNPHGSAATVSFDAYAIDSPGGHLNPGTWNTLNPDDGWVATTPSPGVLSELNPIAATSIAGQGSISLGTPFSPPAAFGVDNENITFRFAKTDASQFTQGSVIYTGISNSTLTLNVDPTTGAAQLVNGTDFDVAIEAYAITSASESLDPSQDAWTSLQEQGTSAGNWFKANVSEGQLSELLVVGGLSVPARSAIPIGTPFDASGGTQDLVFQFAVYGGDKGDFNQDGNRDGLDLLEWQRGNPPSTYPSAEDLADWEAGFGSPVIPGTENLLTGKTLYGPLTALARGGAQPVPEPSWLAMLAACASPAIFARKRTRGASFREYVATVADN